MKRLLIMAAGTGGHIFPGLAIAQTMAERGWQVSWLGTRHGMEGAIVPKHGLEMDKIDFAGMRGKGAMHAAQGCVRLVVSFIACMGILARRKPDVVLGMGGYVTVPGGFAAKLRGIPVVLINADAALLLSNRALASSAKRVLFGFPGNFGSAAGKAQVTGNPVRQEILDVAPPAQRFAGRVGPLRLLVVGGSLGAKVLNDCLPAALALLPEKVRPLVVHQSGRQHREALLAAYAQAKVEADVLEFIDDMAHRYAEADLVICRAGAITVSELAAAGVASILVPFVVSSTAHQRDNAQLMAQHHAALHLPQGELTPQRVAALLQEMTRENCLSMAQNAYAIGRRDANGKIADVLEEMSSTSSN
ncbi:MAG: undecaprenyldiphospho-muramoylpentapeptide beta-N-acetylglucosaminyltransferase [Burkholderiaceae bacterium]|nr:undecaprenyldiphospho-muramoylpentapeptide beta-N-acetylglucosaminyltransferase [Burkholderiaceae bacterium]